MSERRGPKGCGPKRWRYEIDPAEVERNQGKWKGRGKHRKEWLKEQFPIETLVIDEPRSTTRHKARSLEDAAPSQTQSRPEGNSWRLWKRSKGDRLLLFALGVVIGCLPHIKERLKQRRVTPTEHVLTERDLVFDPVTLRWRLR